MAFTLTETLDNLYTTTWQLMKDKVRDQIFTATPFWFWMKEKGKLKAQEGHRYITEPLEYAKNDTITWLSKGGTVTLNDYEFLTTAKFDWKYVAASIVRFGVDDQQNRGKAQIINLMNSKFNNTRNSLIDELETRLFGYNNATGTYPYGLRDLVLDDPTADVTIGGVNGNTYTWWRNKSKNATGKSFDTYGVSYMRTMLNDCMNNRMMDAPDIIICDQTTYEYYEDELLTYKRIVNQKLGDAGFENQTFKGIPMVWSPQCSQRMYFLNTNFLNLVYDPAMNFDLTEWKPIPDQVNDRAAQIVLAANLTVSRRLCQGVIYNIDTA